MTRKKKKCLNLLAIILMSKTISSRSNSHNWYINQRKIQFKCWNYDVWSFRWRPTNRCYGSNWKSRLCNFHAHTITLSLTNWYQRTSSHLRRSQYSTCYKSQKWSYFNQICWWKIIILSKKKTLALWTKSLFFHLINSFQIQLIHLL